MLRHAMKEGLELPPALRNQVAVLDRALELCKVPTLSNVPSCILGFTESESSKDSAESHGEPSKTPDAGSGRPGASTESSSEQKSTSAPPGTTEVMELLYTVHGTLSTVIAPATVASLLATEPATGEERTIFHGMPKIVRWAAIAAVLCAIGFAFTAIPTAEKSARKSAGKTTTNSAATDQGGGTNKVSNAAQ